MSKAGKHVILGLTLLLLFSVCCFAQALQVTKVGEWGSGSYRAVTVQGNYAYCAANWAGLDIVDISDPANPVKVGNCDTSGGPTGVAVSGNYAYVNEFYNLRIIDISDPANPFSAATYQTTCWDMALSGNHVLTVNEGTLTILDVSNPTAPVEAGSCKILSEVSSITASGNHAYVINNNYDDFQVVDISNPAAPAVVGACQPSSYNLDLVAKGNYVYILNGAVNSYIQVVDVSGPTAPRPGASMVFGNNCTRLSLSGDRIYAYSENDTYIYTIDISDPSSPRHAGTYGGNDATFEGLTQSGGYVYGACGDYGLRVLEFSNPDAVTETGRLDIGGNCSDVAVAGNQIYLAKNERGVQVLDVSTPSNPTRTGAAFTAPANRVEVSGQYAYTAAYGGMYIVDISSPATPTLTAYFETYGRVKDIAVSGSYVYLSRDDFGTNDARLEVIDVSDPGNPSLVDTYRPGQYNEGPVAVAGEFLYYTAGTRLIVLDISSPAHPDPVGSFTLREEAEELAIAGSNLYVAMGPKGLEILDISGPASPTLAGTYQPWGGVFDIAVSGRYVYAAGGYSGLYVIDVANPASPILEANYYRVNYAQGVAVSGPTVYLADGAGGKVYLLQMTGTETPSLSLTSPNGGEKWARGSRQAVTWVPNGLSGDLSIALYADGSFHSHIGTADANARVFPWDIPDTLEVKDTYKIRIYRGGTSDESDAAFHIGDPPAITTDKSSLNFAAVKDKGSGAQVFFIGNARAGQLDWTVSSPDSRLSLSPLSGSGDGRVQVSADVSGFPAGTYAGSVTVTSPNASNSPYTLPVTLKVYKAGDSPTGEFATPGDYDIVSGSVAVTGWAIDDVGIESVHIIRDAVEGEGRGRVFIGNAIRVEGARPDVEAAYPEYPENSMAGWGYMLLSNMLPAGGNGTFSLYAVITDREGHRVTLGPKRILCDNANSTAPFGTIDTPAPGETVSGYSYINYGWALTPPPALIPLHGATITVWVDGEPLGSPEYNLPREDIANLFPQCYNSAGPVGSYPLDTTRFTNGIHMISWSVTDDAGNGAGLGSRYVYVENGSARQSPTGGSFHRRIEATAAGREDLYGNPGGAMTMRRGYGKNTPFKELHPDENGEIYIRAEELTRLELNLQGGPGYRYRGYRPVQGQRKPLPAGSRLSPWGTFYWQPGPGFLGVYRLVFEVAAPGGDTVQRAVTVEITPARRHRLPGEE